MAVTDRGKHDNAHTPKPLYDIIVNDLRFTDVCLDPMKFNAAVQLWPNRSFCNPPFSNKSIFVNRAVMSHRAGREVLLYLPFDPTVSWFQTLLDENPLIIIFTKRLGHNRWPTALFHLKDYKEYKVVFVKDINDVKKILS